MGTFSLLKILDVWACFFYVLYLTKWTYRLYDASMNSFNFVCLLPLLSVGN